MRSAVALRPAAVPVGRPEAFSGDGLRRLGEQDAGFVGSFREGLSRAGDGGGGNDGDSDSDSDSDSHGFDRVIRWQPGDVAAFTLELAPVDVPEANLGMLVLGAAIVAYSRRRRANK